MLLIHFHTQYAEQFCAQLLTFSDMRHLTLIGQMIWNE